MVGEPVGTHDAHLPLVAWRVLQRYGAAPSLEVSPSYVLKDLRVQAELSRQALQLPVLLLQFLQPFSLVHPFSPAIAREVSGTPDSTVLIDARRCPCCSHAAHGRLVDPLYLGKTFFDLFDLLLVDKLSLSA